MKLFSHKELGALSARATEAPRRRANENIHPLPEDPVQRFFNAMLPGSYVRPHRHVTPPRWELFLVLQGRIGLLLFDEHGCVLERQDLNAQGPVFGAEVEARRWHALVALEPSLMFEVKEGPYSPSSDKDFADWAPPEGDPAAQRIVDWYRGAQPGERCPW